MDAWRWLDLGRVDGVTMVNVFVAVAGPVGRGASPPTVLVLHPEAPFANVGFHQEVEREIDLDHCRAHGIPVTRRVVGGGAILDGPWEHDYMVIVPQGAPGTQEGVEAFYDRYLRPVRATLQRLGVSASRAGVNDLAVNGRKISANGAMTLDGSWVLVGDILLDLDVDAMSRVLRVPDEKFRGKLVRGMEDWLTSVRRETGKVPSREEVSRMLREELGREFSVELRDGSLSPEETERLARLREERSRDAWTFQKDAAHPRFRSRDPSPGGRRVKISRDVYLGRADHKAGKLLRVTLLSRKEEILEVEISGDFFTLPFDGRIAELERRLVGTRLAPEPLGGVLDSWLNESKVRLVGISREDLLKTILAAGRDTEGPRAPREPPDPT